VAGEGVTFRCAPNGEQIAVDRFAPGGSGLLFNSTPGSPVINAWFFRASVFAKIGPFDASYRIAECEHTRIADLCLGMPSLSKHARELIRRAHTRDTLAGAFYFAAKDNVRKLIQHAAAGTRHDPMWPARFTKRALRGPAWKNGLGGRTE
jgi:hypothetical protein